MTGLPWFNLISPSPLNEITLDMAHSDFYFPILWNYYNMVNCPEKSIVLSRLVCLGLLMYFVPLLTHLMIMVHLVDVSYWAITEFGSYEFCIPSTKGPLCESCVDLFALCKWFTSWVMVMHNHIYLHWFMHLRKSGVKMVLKWATYALEFSRLQRCESDSQPLQKNVSTR